MSLADRFVERFKNSEPPSFEIVSRRCLRSRFSGSSCDRCVRECPVQAIRVAPGGIELDPKRCVGCLACTAVCPAEALVGSESRLAGAWAKVMVGQPAVFCCEKGIRTGEEIVLPCLGALSEEQLLACAVRTGQSVRLHLFPCRGCRASSVPELLARRLEKLRERVGGDGLAPLVKLIRREEEEMQSEGPASRRAFFRACLDISFHAATETIATLRSESDPKEKHAHKYQSARLALLRQTLADCGEEAVRLAMLPLFFTLAVNAECNFCGGCAGICPTGALKNIREEGAKQLQFAWDCCSGCGLCLEFCPQKALSLSAGRSPDSLGPECDVLLRMDIV